jgi:hypothetical protein
MPNNVKKEYAVQTTKTLVDKHTGKVTNVVPAVMETANMAPIERDNRPGVTAVQRTGPLPEPHFGLVNVSTKAVQRSYNPRPQLMGPGFVTSMFDTVEKATDLGTGLMLSEKVTTNGPVLSTLVEKADPTVMTMTGGNGPVVMSVTGGNEAGLVMPAMPTAGELRQNHLIVMTMNLVTAVGSGDWDKLPGLIAAGAVEVSKGVSGTTTAVWNGFTAAMRAARAAWASEIARAAAAAAAAERAEAEAAALAAKQQADEQAAAQLQALADAKAKAEAEALAKAAAEKAKAANEVNNVQNQALQNANDTMNYDPAAGARAAQLVAIADAAAAQAVYAADLAAAEAAAAAARAPGLPWKTIGIVAGIGLAGFLAYRYLGKGGGRTSNPFDSISDAKIEKLRTEAAQARDFEQVDICDRALTGHKKSRSICAEAISEAQAQVRMGECNYCTGCEQCGPRDQVRNPNAREMSEWRERKRWNSKAKSAEEELYQQQVRRSDGRFIEKIKKGDLVKGAGGAKGTYQGWNPRSGTLDIDWER